MPYKLFPFNASQAQVFVVSGDYSENGIGKQDGLGRGRALKDEAEIGFGQGRDKGFERCGEGAQSITVLKGLIPMTRWLHRNDKGLIT